MSETTGNKIVLLIIVLTGGVLWWGLRSGCYEMGRERGRAEQKAEDAAHPVVKEVPPKFTIENGEKMECIAGDSIHLLCMQTPPPKPQKRSKRRHVDQSWEGDPPGSLQPAVTFNCPNGAMNGCAGVIASPLSGNCPNGYAPRLFEWPLDGSTVSVMVCVPTQPEKEPAPLGSGCIGCDLPPLTAKELSERTSVPLCDDSHIVGEHCLQDEAHRPKDYVCVEAPLGMITCGKIYHGPVSTP